MKPPNVFGSPQGRGPASTWETSGLERRDFAGLLLPHLDYDAQFQSIQWLLEQQRTQRTASKARIAEVDEEARRLRGICAEQAVEEWLERLHTSIYDDAAHSMAAVGMLAPLFESLFFQALRAIPEVLPSAADRARTHERFTDDRDKRRWDCRFVWRSGCFKKHIVPGIEQISQIVGLDQFLPDTLFRQLEALFLYRNKMFHNGFEWPLAERQRFSSHPSVGSWFSASERAGELWIFYMTDGFVSECVAAVEEVLKALGAFVLYCGEGSTGSAQ